MDAAADQRRDVDSSDNRAALITTTGVENFCKTIGDRCDFETETIVSSLIREGVLQPEFAAVFREPVTTLIGRIRDNSKAALGKSTALAEALNQDSRDAVTEFLDQFADRIKEFSFVNSNVMHLMGLEAEILGAKDLERFSTDDLQSGMLATLELAEIVSERFISSIAERLARHLTDQGIKANPNSDTPYKERFKRGVIYVGENHFDRAKQLISDFLSTHMPEINFYIEDAGMTPPRAIRISVSGKSKK